MTNDKPIELSDSQTKTAQRCWRLWGYQKLLKLQAPENKDNLVLGNAAHKGIETFVLKGDINTAMHEAAKAVVEGAPSNPQWQSIVVPAMVQGWVLHFWPWFSANYEIKAVEEWFTSVPHPLVRMRGYKDVRSIKRSTGGTAVWDHKTSGQSGGGDLAKNLSMNVQLARYAVAEYRERGAWPEEVALDFLIKPKDDDPAVAAMKARTRAEHYFHRIQQVTPQFAAFAIEVEKQDVILGHQAAYYRSLFEQHGPAAFDYIPANLNECMSYNTLCGFADGCHGGCPAHTRLVHKKP